MAKYYPRLLNLYRRARKACILRLRTKTTLTHPVFVVGAQRSGTSMTLNAFVRSDYSVGIEQDDSRAFEGLLLRPDDVLIQMIADCPTDVIAFKPLHQIQQLRRYLDSFPDLRVVWLVRHYRAAAESAARLWSSIHLSFQDYLKDPATSDWRFEGMTQHQRDVITHFYSPTLSPVTAYALFWHLRNSYFFEHELNHTHRVRLFFYEDLVRCPDIQFRKIMDFCGCAFDPKCCRHVRTVSVHRTDDYINKDILVLCEQLWSRLHGWHSGADTANTSPL